MTSAILTFLLGLGILLVSTKVLVDKSQQLAHKLHISPLIIGITIVAIGTSLPEMAVSTISSIKGDYGLSLGNIVGSNITNVLLVMGVGILVGNLRIGTTKTPKTALIMFFITVLYILMNLFSIHPFLSGAILITLGILSTIIEYKWGINGQNNEDSKLINKFTKNNVTFTFLDLAYLIAAVAGITFGGIQIVKSVENLSAILGYSTTLLGLCLTSVVTSLPELLTTVFSQSNKEEKMTLGNILGSSIYNIAFIGGIVYFFSGELSLNIVYWIWLFFTTTLLLVTIFVLKGKYIPKLLGLVFLANYLAYLFTVAKY